MCDEEQRAEFGASRVHRGVRGLCARAATCGADDAISQGVLGGAMSAELDTAEAAYDAGGFGCVGTPAHDAGFALAREATARGGRHVKEVHHIWTQTTSKSGS
jgi:hypothetical protein